MSSEKSGDTSAKKTPRTAQRVRRSTKLKFYALGRKFYALGRRAWGSLKGQRFSSIVGFLALIVAVLSYAFPRSGALSEGRLVPEPPANSICNYNLSWDRTEAYDQGFGRGDSIEQPIDAQLTGLKSIISVGPVTDYDARGVDLLGLRGVTLELRQDGETIRSESVSLPNIKTVPAPFNFEEVQIDHSKRYAVVVTNTTTQDIAIWINKRGILNGYRPASLNGVEIDGSLSGRVCGFN